MLTAETMNGTLLNLADQQYRLKELMQLRRSTSYFCPGCRQPVVMKLGHKRTWHFAHQGSPPCEALWERESNYHLTGKLQLYEWLNKENDVKVEHYLTKTNQRPDLFLPHAQTALEFQCSSIQATLLSERTSSYHEANIEVQWILSAKRLKRSYQSVYTMSSMEWASACHQHRYPTLYYYCPLERTFATVIIHQSLTPTKFICSAFYTPISTTSFNCLFKKLSVVKEKLNSHPIWLKQKLIWRQNPHGEKSFAYFYLRKLFYSKGHSIRFFPSEAGIPSENNYWIETPSYLWQTWILICYLPTIPRSFTFHSLVQAFERVIPSGLFRTRSTPMHINGISDALRGYVRQLVRLKVLKEWDNERYEKLYQPLIHRHSEESIQMDHIISKKLM
ncbi:competence protein CoiA [Guptibacillus spartinae]|uniref:competence protein CoiA n=1 Tax=Guptibacillus spartinae TaxID=3025679 RepID=UPI0023604F74|nr:competence protein CoiA family protein [Pseudalkalibacillus spartinae]